MNTNITLSFSQDEMKRFLEKLGYEFQDFQVEERNFIRLNIFSYWKSVTYASKEGFDGKCDYNTLEFTFIKELKNKLLQL